MPKIEIEWTAQSNIRNEAVRLARPLLEVAALQAVKTRDRIQKTGIGGSGRSFRPYAESSKKARARLGLQTSYKDFTRSGTFWRSMKAKLQSPTKASVVFTGRAAKGKRKTAKEKVVRLTNAALARVVLSKETQSLFSMGQKEVNAISEYLAGRLTMDILVEQFVEESGFQLARKTRSMERRAKKAVHSLRGR